VAVIVRGPSYEAPLQRLVAALELQGPGVYIDPVLGSLTVVVARWSVGHSAEWPDSAEVAIRFVQQGQSTPVFSLPAAGSSADLAAAAADQARDVAAQAAAGALSAAAGAGIPRVRAITDAVNQAKAKLRTLLDTTSVRVLLSDLDPLIYPQATLADLRAIVDGAFQGLPFGGLNPLSTSTTALADTDNMASAQADFSRLVQGQSTAVTITPVSSDQADVDVANVMTAACRVINATAVANAAGLILAAEVSLLGLGADEIERLAATARTALQAAMHAARLWLGSLAGAEAADQLARAAVHVQDAARAALEQHPPVITRQAPIGGTARLLAHALYGDHTRAPQLARLNNWGRTVFVDAGQEIQAYAR
jgi:prophage DNA circulation protein